MCQWGCKLPPLPQGIFLVYDIGSERSYQHIVKWASDVDEVGGAGRSGGGPVPHPVAGGGGGCPHTTPSSPVRTRRRPENPHREQGGRGAQEASGQRARAAGERGLACAPGGARAPPCTPSMARDALPEPPFALPRDPNNPAAALPVSRDTPPPRTPSIPRPPPRLLHPSVSPGTPPRYVCTPRAAPKPLCSHPRRPPGLPCTSSMARDPQKRPVPPLRTPAPSVRRPRGCPYASPPPPPPSATTDSTACPSVRA